MIEKFLEEVKSTIDKIEINELKEMIGVLKNVRERKGRLFLIGSGGGAGHASHACADFRKLCGIEAYAPYDNVSELTARTNDDGYDTTIIEYLKGSGFNKKDCHFVFSVGGGTPNISRNIYNAIIYAFDIKADIVGVAGKEPSALATYTTARIIIESVYPTPITEGLQAVIWHLLVNELKINEPVW